MELKDVYGYNGNKTKAYTNRGSRGKMHPSGLKTFIETLMMRAKNIGSQIIATTHSIEFIKIAMETSTKNRTRTLIDTHSKREWGTRYTKTIKARHQTHNGSRHRSKIPRSILKVKHIETRTTKTI